MHALACICRTALSVDLFAKESVRRGQKPQQNTDIASLFEDIKIREDLASVNSESLFREELVACLVESCFQLSVPLPRTKATGPESRVIGALTYGTVSGAMSWTQSALEVVEVCRPCVKWDCQGTGVSNLVPHASRQDRTVLGGSIRISCLKEPFCMWSLQTLVDIY